MSDTNTGMVPYDVTALQKNPVHFFESFAAADAYIAACRRLVQLKVTTQQHARPRRALLQGKLVVVRTRPGRKPTLATR